MCNRIVNKLVRCAKLWAVLLNFAFTLPTCCIEFLFPAFDSKVHEKSHQNGRVKMAATGNVKNMIRMVFDCHAGVVRLGSVRKILF